jgi:holliday junction DNA helicase RuvA
MIGYLEGKITFRGERYIILDVAGVGYKVFVNLGTLKKTSGGNEKTKLWTHLYQREDTIDLYGFSESSELQLFETLIGVSGVGPRTALAVLGVAPSDTLRRAIASGEVSYLTKVSGIGRKTAEKIMIELREKFGKAHSDTAGEFREEKDALEALEALGYSVKEARDALKEVPESIKGMNEKIKEALKILGGAK